MSIKSISFLCFLFQPVFAIAVTNPGTDHQKVTLPTGRITRACAAYLTTPNPYLFSVSRNGRSALLFGASEVGEASHLLPDFAQDAVTSSKFILEGTLVNNEEQMKLITEATQSLENDQNQGVIQQLGDLAAAYQKFLGDIGVASTDVPKVSPLLANALLSQLMLVTASNLTAEDIERAQAIETIVDEMDPPVNQEEFVQFMNENNLMDGISKLASLSGVKRIDFVGPGVAEEFLAKFRTVEMTRELVQGLLTIEKSQIKEKSFNKSTWDEFNQSADSVLEHFPTQALAQKVSLREAAEKIDRVFEKHDGLLMNVALPSIAGKYGLVEALRRLGFEIRRLESKADWDAFKPSFVRP